MSKHWKPDEGVVRPLRTGRRLKSLHELRPPDFLGRMHRVERQLPHGAKAGLLLVAAACLGIAIGAYLAFGPRDIIAPEAKAGERAADAAPNG
jgi:hypothetical protein